MSLLRTWLTAIQCWDKVMFGTDWPIVNLGEYIGFIRPAGAGDALGAGVL